MSAGSESPRSLLGLLIALAVMLAVSLVVFLPLFLGLSAPSMWRYLTWAAAFFGPRVGGELGARLARRLGCPPRQQSLQQAALLLICVLGLVSVLPFLTRT